MIYRDKRCVGKSPKGYLRDVKKQKFLNNKDLCRWVHR